MVIVVIGSYDRALGLRPLWSDRIKASKVCA